MSVLKGTKSTAPETPIIQTVVHISKAMGNIHQKWNQTAIFKVSFLPFLSFVLATRLAGRPAPLPERRKWSEMTQGTWPGDHPQRQKTPGWLSTFLFQNRPSQWKLPR